MEIGPKVDPAEELREALEVLEEYCHLGLDDEHANKLRKILERRIGEAEETESCCPAQPVRFPLPSQGGE